MFHLVTHYKSYLQENNVAAATTKKCDIVYNECGILPIWSSVSEYAFSEDISMRRDTKKKERISDIVGVCSGVLLLAILVFSIVWANTVHTVGVSNSAVPASAMTVQGTADGRNGPITVEVVADQDQIYQLRVLSQEETDGIGSEAITKRSISCASSPRRRRTASAPRRSRSSRRRSSPGRIWTSTLSAAPPSRPRRFARPSSMRCARPGSTPRPSICAPSSSRTWP